MPEDTPSTARDLLTPRKVAIQLVGFLLGLALLAWCIVSAIKGGDWSRLAEADPLLLAGLLGCSLVSLAANGAIFWAVIRPVEPLRFVDLQLINLVSGVLNYAPIRAGMIARMAYHLRIDRIGILLLGAWLAAIAATLFLTTGALLGATVVFPSLDWRWLLVLLGLLLLGGLLLRALLSQRVFERFGRGMEQMLVEPRALWSALAFRLLDLAAFGGRMYCAVTILELGFSASEIVLLSIATITLTLVPISRVGFREAGVAFVAGWMSGGYSAVELEGTMQQLALVESAGEAAVVIPLGLVSLIWFRRKWKQANSNEDAAAASGRAGGLERPA